MHVVAAGRKRGARPARYWLSVGKKLPTFFRNSRKAISTPKFGHRAAAGFSQLDFHRIRAASSGDAWKVRWFCHVCRQATAAADVAVASKDYRQMRSCGLLSWRITVALIVTVLALYPASGKQRSKKSTVPALSAYGTDIQQTSVSGVSSGGAMAVQMHVAHSAIMRGTGVIAGVTYDCANSGLMTAAQRLAQGLLCLPGNVDYAPASIARTAAAAAVPGAIDDPAANLPRQKVWLFSGYNDGSVRRGAMNAVDAYYRNYAASGNVFYQIDNRAPHALVTDNYGGPCLGVNVNYINNCGYDAAGHLLQHIYGRLKPPDSSAASGSILAFDQGEFVPGGKPNSVGLADTAYVYVPNSCRSATACRVHVVFHGCKQYAEKVGNAVYRHAGYNRWASSNRIIVLYPQTTTSTVNPEGCFDWWGFSQSVGTSDFARKSGPQISAFKKMLDRLAQGFVAAPGSPDPFGPPVDFSVADSTSTSLALIWTPSASAAGFNIYRSAASAGSYAKINSTLVVGASFADGGLNANTTYYYQISAVNSVGQESAKASPISGTTAAQPVACDPYFSNNLRHVAEARARVDLAGKVRALGSNDNMGAYSQNVFRQLDKDGPFSYRLRYCP